MKLFNIAWFNGKGQQIAKGISQYVRRHVAMDPCGFCAAY